MRRKPWRNTLRAALALLAAALLFGCGSDVLPGNSVEFEEDPGSSGHPAARGFTANLDLTRGVVPSATNLLFSGSQDGTLNIPILPSDSDGARALKATLNALDGFSTVAPFSTTFSAPIDPASLTPATVRMFEVTLTGIGGAVTGVTRELAFGTEFAAMLSSVDPSRRTLAIVPLRPLKPRTSYLVALTSGIRSTDGRSAMASDHYLTAKTVPNDLTGTPAQALEPVRRLVQAQEAALAAFGMDPAPVVLSWTLTTQSTAEVLARVRELAQGAAAVAPGPAATTGALVPGSPDLAFVYVGTLTIPYYLGVPSAEAPTAPLTRYWLPTFGEHLTGLNAAVGPAKTADQTIPLVLTVPRTARPAGGKWPVVVFQHGITTNRSVVLAVADALAAAGFAAVSIDLPLHGLPPGHPLRLPGVGERTFDLDLADNVTGAPGPDGVVDASGTHFINLSSLLTSRDNLRQAVADLFALVKSLETLDYDGGGADLDPSEVYFLGHSLGGMVGTPFLALEPGVRSAVLAMPGGGIAKLLDGSASFGPRIEAGLAANGLLKGTADYESFFAVAQAALDSADPLNFAQGAVSGRGMLLYQVQGDRTVPNTVLPDNPDLPAGTVPSVLAGTAPLIRALGLTRVGATTPAEGLSPTPLLAWIHFTAGTHASLLDPGPSLAATQVMQGAAAAFFATDGGRVVIADPSVVLAP